MIGARFDKEGNLANWWSNKSLKHFQNREICLVKEYTQCIVQGHHVSNTAQRFKIIFFEIAKCWRDLRVGQLVTWSGALRDTLLYSHIRPQVKTIVKFC